MRLGHHKYPEMLLSLELERRDNQLDKKLDSFKDRVIASKVKEAEIMDEFTDILYNVNVTETIPFESFSKIIKGITSKDFNTLFEFDCGEDSEDVWQDFEMFHIEPDGDGYLVRLYLKVDYEVLRGEVVNDVSFSIDEITVYDNEGDEMVLDYRQADQIKKAVESQNYKA